MNQKKSKELSDEIFETLEKQIIPKAFQHTLISLLKNNKTLSPDFIQKIKSFYKEAEAISQKSHDFIYPDNKTKVGIACGIGCSFCCHMNVMATAPEFHIISKYLKNTFSKEKINSLKKTLRESVSAITKCKNITERSVIQCSFLENKACSIYDVRPFTCRAFNSTNIEFCEKYLLNQKIKIPANMCHYAPFDAFKKGITQALEVVGFDNPIEELNSGILRLLE
jgi:Fe-S-cluster containining protein